MGIAMLAAASGSIGAQLGSGLGSIAEDLLGLKSSSDLFIGILQSRTVQDDLINKFNLRNIYSDRRMEDAREDLVRVGAEILVAGTSIFHTPDAAEAVRAMKQTADGALAQKV